MEIGGLENAIGVEDEDVSGAELGRLFDQPGLESGAQGDRAVAELSGIALVSAKVERRRVAGTDQGDGTWLFEPGELEGLTLTSPLTVTEPGPVIDRVES